MEITFEQQYKQLIRDILTHGSVEANRTGVDTLTLFNKEISFDLGCGLMPVITGKRIFYDKGFHEFQWMVRGDTNVDYLNTHNIRWWNEYADMDGELGKTYGYQLRKYNGDFDQLKYAMNEITRGSRRAHITLWNPSELKETALPCCYTGMTFVLTDNGQTLNMSMSFRSSDVFLGLPYDFIVGALFLKYMAEGTATKVGVISYQLNNAHIYTNHISACQEYIASKVYPLPEFRVGDDLPDYESGPHIQAKLNN